VPKPLEIVPRAGANWLDRVLLAQASTWQNFCIWVMRILVTFAVEAEFAPWRKLRDLEQITPSGVDAFRVRVGSAKVDFVVTGVGVQNASRVTSALLGEPYQVCITSGFAGALKEEHKVGHILVADGVQLLGKAKTLQCARNLVYAARDDGAKRVNLFLTSDHVVRTADEKRQLSPFADAVEMESFAVLSAAAAQGRSAVAIRIISDDVGNDMPAIIDTAVDKMGNVKIAGVARYIARHPLQLPALIRLGRDSKTAAEALAHFLEAFIKKLSSASHGWPPPELREVAAP
jgi:adenosylhomocysteine nucleosidase